MQVDLIFPLRAHLEGSIQMSKTAGISHIHCIKRGKKTQLCFTREGDEEAQTAQFIIESQACSWWWVTHSRTGTGDEHLINDICVSSDAEVTHTKHKLL